eukprot:g2211.t1
MGEFPAWSSLHMVTSLIQGYGLVGDWKSALRLYRECSGSSSEGSPLERLQSGWARIPIEKRDAVAYNVALNQVCRALAPTAAQEELVLLEDH